MVVPQEVLTTSPPRREDSHDVIAEQGVPCDGTGIMYGTTGCLAGIYGPAEFASRVTDIDWTNARSFHTSLDHGTAPRVISPSSKL